MRFDDIPHDCVFMICTRMSITAVIRLSRVSKKFYEDCSEFLNYVKKQRYRHIFEDINTISHINERYSRDFIKYILYTCRDKLTASGFIRCMEFCTKNMDLIQFLYSIAKEKNILTNIINRKEAWERFVHRACMYNNLKGALFFFYIPEGLVDGEFHTPRIEKETIENILALRDNKEFVKYLKERVHIFIRIACRKEYMKEIHDLLTIYKSAFPDKFNLLCVFCLNMYALRTGNWKIINIFLDFGSNMRLNSGALAGVCRSSKIEFVREFVKEYYPFNVIAWNRAFSNICRDGNYQLLIYFVDELKQEFKWEEYIKPLLRGICINKDNFENSMKCLTFLLDKSNIDLSVFDQILVDSLSYSTEKRTKLIGKIRTYLHI